MATLSRAEDLAAVVDPMAARPELWAGIRVGCLGSMGFGAAPILLLALGFTVGAPMLPGSALLECVTGSAVALLLCSLLLLRSIRPPKSARASLAAAATMVLFGLGVGALAVFVLQHPIVHASDCHFCSADHGFDAIPTAVAAASIAPMGAGLLPVLGVVLGRRLVAARSVSVVRGVRGLAWTLVALASATSLVALLGRKSRVGWPEYVESLPVVGSLAASPTASGAVPPGWKAINGDTLGRSTARIGIASFVGGPNRDVAVDVTGVVPTGFSFPPPVHGAGELRLGGRGIVMRRDLRRDVLYVESDGSHSARAGAGVVTDRLAFRESKPSRIDVRATDLADLLPPPRSWVLLGVASIPIALLILLLRPPIASLRARSARWREVTYDGDREFTLPDGERVVLPADGRLLPGIITVVLADPPESRAYRDSLAETIVVAPCTAAVLEHTIDTALAARALWAVAVLTIAASPLFALAAL